MSSPSSGKMMDYCDRTPNSNIYSPSSQISTISVKFHDEKPKYRDAIYVQFKFDEYDIIYDVICHNDSILKKNQSFVFEYKEEHSYYEKNVFKYSDNEFYKLSRYVFYDFRFHIIKKRYMGILYNLYSTCIYEKLCEDFNRFDEILKIVKTSARCINTLVGDCAIKINKKHDIWNIYNIEIKNKVMMTYRDRYYNDIGIDLIFGILLSY